MELNINVIGESVEAKIDTLEWAKFDESTYAIYSYLEIYTKDCKELIQVISEIKIEDNNLFGVKISCSSYPFLFFISKTKLSIDSNKEFDIDINVLNHEYETNEGVLLLLTRYMIVYLKSFCEEHFKDRLTKTRQLSTIH